MATQKDLYPEEPLLKTKLLRLIH